MSSHELGRVNKLKSYFEELATTSIRKQSIESANKKSIPKSVTMTPKHERKSDDVFQMCGVDIKSVSSSAATSKSSIGSRDNHIDVIYERFSVELDDDNEDEEKRPKDDRDTFGFYLAKLLKLVLTAKCYCVCLVENHSDDIREKSLAIFDQLNLKAFNKLASFNDSDLEIYLSKLHEELTTINNQFHELISTEKMSESKLSSLFERMNSTVNLIVSIQKLLPVKEDEPAVNLDDLMKEVESEISIYKRDSIKGIEI